MTDTATPRASIADAAPPARRLRRARWNDRRVLVGVALAGVSVFGVAQVVSAADQTSGVWTMTHDLGPGVSITAGDVSVSAVHLDTDAPYFGEASSPVGSVTTRGFAAGELVARAGVAAEGSAAETRFLTLPIERHHLPGDLARGEQVDVYLVERTVSGEPTGQPSLVLAAATVAEVEDGDSRFGGSGLELGVALSVPLADVAELVAAEARGTLTLVRVPLDLS